KAIKEAELHAAEDKERKEKVDVKNKAESTVFQTEKALEDFGDKVSEDDKAPIKEALEKLKDAISKDDTEAMKTETENVSNVLMKLGEKFYQASGAQGAAPNPEDFAGYGDAGAAGAQGAANGGDAPDGGFKNAGGDF
ncbi:MAG: Hsp70 family protein, partial [Clostridiales bacterium]|nr:Hsp70 family protein [Clostridiales bacterium]